MPHIRDFPVPSWRTVLAVALVFCIGCSTSQSGQQRSEKTVESFRQTRKSLSDAGKQVQITDSSLRNLTTTSDLRPAFDRFVENVRQMQKMASSARERASAMREKTNEYITQWQAEMMSGPDQQSRRADVERLAAARTDFDRVRIVAQEVRAAYDPYMQNLQEVREILGNDLTSAGQQAVNLRAVRVVQMGDSLQRKLAEAERELDRLSENWGPK